MQIVWLSLSNFSFCCGFVNLSLEQDLNGLVAQGHHLLVHEDAPLVRLAVLFAVVVERL